MRELKLKTPAGECRILIGGGLLSRTDLFPAASPPVRGAIIVDGHVRRQAAGFIKTLAESGIIATPFVIPPGERSKSFAAFERLLRGLAREQLERSAPVFAFGGGVVGDLAGFAAATYLRGVPFHQVPTTLLAQVDAAIGGKTGVNLPEGKNLVGAFHQPRTVLIDPAILATLPERDFIGGLAEVVKYGMIVDAAFFVHLEKNLPAILKRDPELLENVIFRCVSHKVSIVEKDERESGLRAILNYGHTIGHAIEAAGDYGRVHHGEAISLGMEAAAFIAMRMGLASVETLAAQNRMLESCGLPTRMAALPRREILRAMESDKKRRDGRHRFVLPERIGKVKHGVEVPAELVEAALKTISRR